MASSSAGPSTGSTDKELQNALYDRCARAPANELLKQSDLLAFGVIPNSSTDKLMECVQALLKKNLLQVYSSGGETSFKVVKRETAEKYQRLSQDESLVMQCIESSGREGIWTRTLKLRTNIHQSNVTRALKSLESQNQIRSVRSVKNPNHILYMLTSFTPSEEVTGGPWFTDGELDTDFITDISRIIMQYLNGRSFHKVSSDSARKTPRRPPSVKREPDEPPKPPPGDTAAPPATTGSEPSAGQKRPHPSSSRAKETLLPFSPTHQGYATAEETKRFINTSGITAVVLTEAHIQRLLDVLYYDGRIEKVMNGAAYKAVRPLPGGSSSSRKEETFQKAKGVGMAYTEAPCGRCPVFHLCEEGGPVSASNCEYFADWLKF